MGWPLFRSFVDVLLFLKVRKKLWLTPILLALLIIGAILIFAEGSIFAPFIYTLF